MRGRVKMDRRLADRLTPAAVVWLTAGLASSVFVILAFAKLTDEVIEGEKARRKGR